MRRLWLHLLVFLATRAIYLFINVHALVAPTSGLPAWVFTCGSAAAASLGALNAIVADGLHKCTRPPSTPEAGRPAATTWSREAAARLGGVRLCAGAGALARLAHARCGVAGVRVQL